MPSNFKLVYKKIWNMALGLVTFLPHSSTKHSLKGLVRGGFSLPFELRFVDLLTVHSPQ
jgi:hypothetical protein